MIWFVKLSELCAIKVPDWTLDGDVVVKLWFRERALAENTVNNLYD